VGDESEEAMSAGPPEGMGEGATGSAPVEQAWDKHSLDDTDITPSEVPVSGLETLNLEVSILSIAAVDKIAQEIGRRIKPIVQQRKLKGVIVADPGSIEMLRTHWALMGELAALEAQVAAAKIPDGGDGGLGAGFVDPGTVYTAARGVRAIANNVGKALRAFESTSTYQGAQVQIAKSVLHAALAKHIAASGIEAQVPRYSVTRKAGSEFIDRLLKLQRRCQTLIDGGADSTEIADISARMGSLVLSVFDTGGDRDGMADGSGSPLMQQLAEAEMFAAAVGKGFGLLTVEQTASGGSYRMRKWILNGLLGRDSLTYSGGAAVTYFLLAGDSMAALASDTIYFASGHGSFGNKYQRFSATNIRGLEGY
jgi:hypothetical protein